MSGPTAAGVEGSAPGRRVSRGERVPDAPDVSIVILVTTSTKRLVRCLGSLRATADPNGPRAEVIVMANATPPDALEEIARDDDLVLVRSRVNLGFGGGANWASQYARADHLIFLNDDAVVMPGWLGALVRAAELDPSAGIVGSRVIRADGRLQEVGSVLWRDGSVWGVGRLLPGNDPELLVTREVDYVSFCAALVRRAAWVSLGGFDDLFYPAYYEDADLCLRARAAGWRVICAPSAVVTHAEGASTTERFRGFLSRRNQLQFVRRWSPLLQTLDPRPADERPRAMNQAALASLGARFPAAASEHAQATGQAPRSRTAAPGTSGDPCLRPPLPADDDAAALAVERRHLESELMVLTEYAANLGRELDGLTLTTLAQRRYHLLRNAVGRRIRRQRTMGSLLSRARHPGNRRG